MTRRGKRILFIAGLAVYVAGLVLLVFVNSRADNWAGAVSPFMILGGLATLFISLVLRADDDEEPGASPGEEGGGASKGQSTAS